MSARYSVRVTKDYLVFCAAHFITYEGDQCERLHGHNYRVAAELFGDLDANQYLFDFIALKNHLMKLTESLDHRMLIPAASELIKTETFGDRVILRFRNRTWMFPVEDCVMLPIKNTTAELLAKHFSDLLLVVLREQHQFEPVGLNVEVEESFGQSATYEWRRG